MSFLVTIGKFISREVLERFGEDIIRDGRRFFSEELAKGTPKQEAARKTAVHMHRYAAGKGMGAVKAAGKKAGKAAVKGAKVIQDRLKKY